MENAPPEAPPPHPTPPSMEQAQPWAMAVTEQPSSVVSVLIDVAEGNLSGHVEMDLPAEHPLGPLCRGVNAMVAALRAEREQNDEFRRSVEEKLLTAEQQKSALREEATPIMEVWEG